MIIRILGEGQWELGDDSLDELNVHDDQVQAALESDDQDALRAALQGLVEVVRRGQQVPDDSLVDSDLIIPAADASLDEVRAALDESGSSEGLIPG